MRIPGWRPARGESAMSFFLLRFEVECGGIDAEALAGRLRAVLEHMAEVGAAVRAANLGADHAVGPVAAFLDAAGFRRLPERRPARTRIVFRGRREQRLAADHAEVHAVLLVAVVLAGEGALSALLLRHVILLGRQARPKFLVARLRHAATIPKRGRIPLMRGGMPFFRRYARRVAS